MFISSHVGEGWKDVGRLLNYSDGQVYQFEEANIIRGVKEVCNCIVICHKLILKKRIINN